MGIESYSKAKTHYVREKIKSKQWKDRGLIDICLSFEEIISKGGPWQWAQAMAYNADRQQYKEEWVAIFKELKPREYKKFLARERRELIENAKRRARVPKMVTAGSSQKRRLEKGGRVNRRRRNGRDGA